MEQEALSSKGWLTLPHAQPLRMHAPVAVVPIQWNLPIEDTIGTQLAVLYREVSPIQVDLNTQLYVVGTADSVLIGEVSIIQSVLYREVPL